MAAREPLVLLALKVAQVIGVPVLADVRIMRRLGPGRAGARPYQVPPIIVDVWSRVDVSVGRDEDVARGDELGAEDFEVYYWGVEVGSLSGGLVVSKFRACRDGSWRWVRGEGGRFTAYRSESRSRARVVIQLRIGLSPQEY